MKRILRYATLQANCHSWSSFHALFFLLFLSCNEKTSRINWEKRTGESVERLSNDCLLQHSLHDSLINWLWYISAILSEYLLKLLCILTHAALNTAFKTQGGGFFHFFSWCFFSNSLSNQLTLIIFSLQKTAVCCCNMPPERYLLEVW